MFTPDERRGALTLLLIILLGALWDVSRLGSRPSPSESGANDPGPAVVSAERGGGDRPDSAFAAAAARSGAEAVAPAPGGLLDLNRATAAELDGLPGIGPVLAGRILEHRARIGRFDSVDELREVRGVGPRLLERLRPRVRAGTGR